MVTLSDANTVYFCSSNFAILIKMKDLLTFIIIWQSQEVNVIWKAEKIWKILQDIKPAEMCKSSSTWILLSWNHINPNYVHYMLYFSTLSIKSLHSIVHLNYFQKVNKCSQCLKTDQCFKHDYCQQPLRANAKTGDTCHQHLLKTNARISDTCYQHL